MSARSAASTAASDSLGFLQKTTVSSDVFGQCASVQIGLYACFLTSWSSTLLISKGGSLKSSLYVSGSLSTFPDPMAEKNMASAR